MLGAGNIKVNAISKDLESCAIQNSVGKILKEARQKHKVRDLNAIAKELCIRPYLLEALEQGNFGSFPSYCYATGFLKNYASYLNLDNKEIISRYEAEYEGSRDCVVLDFPEVEEHESFSLKRISSVAALCVILLGGVWATNNSFDAKAVEEDLPTNDYSLNEITLSPETQTVTKPAAIAENKISDPAPLQLSATRAGDIKLSAQEDVWIRISDQKGTIIVDKILAKGENISSPSGKGLKLMTNNAAALSVSFGDQTVQALGKKGEIIENVTLEQNKLLEFSMLH